MKISANVTLLANVYLTLHASSGFPLNGLFLIFGYSIRDVLTSYGGIPEIISLLVIGLGAIKLIEVNNQLQRQRHEQNRVAQALQQRNDEIVALQRASLQITSQLELKPILETIIQNVLSLVYAEDVHIFLYEDEHLTFGAAVWEGQQQQQPYREPRLDGVT
jgi:hypothetical protein